MKNPEVSVHYLQNEIIRRLSLRPKLRFNELIIEGLESEHMNYHLKKLLDLKFVGKDKEYYQLTDLGKDYSNSMDDENKYIEKQPKTSILIRGLRKNKKGEVDHLLSKRLKQPYYGKIGRLSGKVKFGETLVKAAQRELYEETGLKAEFIQLEEIYHKLRFKNEDNFVQDVVFYVFFMTGFKGKFIKKTSYQENLWISKSEVKKQKLDLFENLVLNNRYKPKRLKLIEDISVADGY